MGEKLSSPIVRKGAKLLGIVASAVVLAPAASLLGCGEDDSQRTRAADKALETQINKHKNSILFASGTAVGKARVYLEDGSEVDIKAPVLQGGGVAHRTCDADEGQKSIVSVHIPGEEGDMGYVEAIDYFNYQGREVTYDQAVQASIRVPLVLPEQASGRCDIIFTEGAPYLYPDPDRPGVIEATDPVAFAEVRSSIYNENNP